MIKLKKQPKILQTKNKIISLVRKHPNLFNLVITDRKIYYLKGVFLVDGVEYFFLLQYYVRYFPRVDYIDIENRSLKRFYKHLYPGQLKSLLSKMEAITTKK